MKSFIQNAFLLLVFFIASLIPMLLYNIPDIGKKPFFDIVTNTVIASWFCTVGFTIFSFMANTRLFVTIYQKIVELYSDGE